MRILAFVMVVFSFFIGQIAFAYEADSRDNVKSEQCEIIAKACKKAGFTRDKGTGKLFWFDCMKPVLYKQSVKGVNIDPEVSRACREAKIKELENQLNELKNITNN